MLSNREKIVASSDNRVACSDTETQDDDLIGRGMVEALAYSLDHEPAPR
jgi:hypothetical protein